MDDKISDLYEINKTMYAKLSGKINIKPMIPINDTGLCTKIGETDDLLECIESHYTDRSNSLSALGNFFDYADADDNNNNNNNNTLYPNMDFIKYFYKYLTIGDPKGCLCSEKNNIINTEREFGRGKLGIAKSVRINNKKYIIKEIANVLYGSYLSMRVNFVEELDKLYVDSSPSILHNKVKGRYSEYQGIGQNSKNKTNDIILHVNTDDEFTNQTCINMILNKIFQDMPIDERNYVYQYDAFYCKKSNWSTWYNGYSLMELADYGDLSAYIMRQSDIKDELLVILCSK